MKRIRQAGRPGALLAIALLAAACSSSAPGPGVASATSPGTAGGSGSAAPGQSAAAGGMAEGVAYAQCMRSHGLPKFPDPAPGPNGQLGWKFGQGSGIDPSSAQYQAAVKACGQPPNMGGGTPPPPLTAAQEQQYLKWAACIRVHGVPDFKDPTFSGGHPQITYNGSNAAQMNAAQQACQSYLRGIPGGGGAMSSGGPQ